MYLIQSHPKFEKELATWFWGPVERAILDLKCSFTAEGQFQCVICGKIETQFYGPVRSIHIDGRGGGYAHAGCC